MFANIHKGFALVTLTGLLLAASAEASRGKGSESSEDFRSGQLVVAGTPESLGGAFEVVKYLPHADLTVIAVPRGQELMHRDAFAGIGRRAGLNRKVSISMSPNDMLYSPYQWNLGRVQGEQAWDLADGTGSVIAVLDTGLAMGGNDGIPCVVAGTDIVNGDSDPHDDHKHGSHVAGTIAQATNNATGVAGLAPGACIMPVKVLDAIGDGDFADLADGIYWAVDNGADVINMSLGTLAQSQVMSDPLMDPALDYAYANGVVVVAAAGNQGSNDNVSYPAIHPTVIAVGATDFLDARASYSNAGSGLDIMAPGGDTGVDLNGDGFGDGILQETLSAGSWGYFFFQGTSMATPHVAAAAGMVIAYGAASGPDAVKNLLISTARDLGSSGYDSTTGHGLLQLHDALLAGGGGGSCTDGDDDGYCTSDGDCNDSDGSVNPGAAEVCGDGVDNNCDGQVDEGCTPPNEAPTAAFSVSCSDLDCSFSDLSSDSDGSVVSRSWDFGDGGASGASNPSHGYGAEGTYTVTLTVTDDDGDTDSASQQVSVTAPPADPAADVALDAQKRNGRKGKKFVDLDWQGASTAQVDVICNGGVISRTDNDGTFTDTLGKKDRGTFVYQICEVGGSNCSNLSPVDL